MSDLSSLTSLLVLSSSVAAHSGPSKGKNKQCQRFASIPASGGRDRGMSVVVFLFVLLNRNTERND